METDITNFKQMMEKCLFLLERMNIPTRKNLESFWRDILVQFENLFSQYDEETAIQGNQELPDSGLQQQLVFVGYEEGAHFHKAIHVNDNQQSTQPDGDTLLRLVNEEEVIETHVPTLQVEPVQHSPDVKPRRTKLPKGGRRHVSGSSPRRHVSGSSPRRSSRKGKPPTAYKDYVTSNSTFSVKNVAVSAGYHVTVLDKEVGFDLQPVAGVHGEQAEIPDDSGVISTLGNVIMFKTVNPFPETSEGGIDDQHGGTDHRALQLTANAAVDNVKTTEEVMTDSCHDHIYSNQSSEPVQIVVTVLNQEEEYLVASTGGLEDTGDELRTAPQVIQSQHGGPEVNVDHKAEDEELLGQLDATSNKWRPVKAGSSCRQTSNQKTVLGIRKNGDGIYECPECGKRITNYSNLRVHMRIHSGEKPYGCRVCSRLFSTITNKTRHERTTHDKEKLWQCEQCQKRFTEKKSLVIHQRIHSGERPYKCTVCGQAFAQAGTLKTHVHRHQGIKGHLCDFCGKSFRQKSQLCMHQRRHSNTRNFKCTVCPKAFVTKTELSRHHMSHSGERPYLCSHCPKTFTRLQYLKEHTNMHTNTTPYNCKMCSQAFHDLASHAKHVKRHSAVASGGGEAQVEKETYIVLPNTEFFMEEVEKANAVLQVPTMVNEADGEEEEGGEAEEEEECVKEGDEGEKVQTDIQIGENENGKKQILNISNLALAMHNSDISNLVAQAQLGLVPDEQTSGYMTAGGSGTLSAVSGGGEAVTIKVRAAEDMEGLGEQYIIIKQQ